MGKIAGKNKTRRPASITKKQLALVKAKLANPDLPMADAAKKAGYKGKNRESLSSQAQHALQSANVRERFQAAMRRRKELSDDALAAKLAEGLDAKVTKLFAHEGHIVDSEEMVDYPTRATYIGLAAKLGGIEVSRTEVSGPNGSPLIPESNPAVASLTKEDLLALIAAMDATPPPATPAPAIKEESTPGSSPEKEG